MVDDNMSSTKAANLQNEYLLSNNCWVQVGTVFNVFMRPLLSGPVKVIPNYSCTENGMTGTGIYSKLRKNMIVIYDRKKHCVIHNQLELDLTNMMIKAFKNGMQLMVPNMQNLTLNFNKFQEQEIHCLSSFHNKFLVYTKIQDCGEEAAQWISEYLKRPKLSLGYVVPEKMSMRTFWHDMKDLYILHPDERDIAVSTKMLPHYRLISYRSFIEVNKSLNYPITIDEYNVDICIIPDDTEPFTELEWEWIQVGNVVLRNITPWKKHVKINLKEMPVEMQMQMIVLYCELYQTGNIQSGDAIKIRTLPTKRTLRMF